MKRNKIEHINEYFSKYIKLNDKDSFRIVKASYHLKKLRNKQIYVLIEYKHAYFFSVKDDVELDAEYFLKGEKPLIVDNINYCLACVSNSETKTYKFYYYNDAILYLHKNSKLKKLDIIDISFLKEISKLINIYYNDYEYGRANFFKYLKKIKLL